MSFVNFTPNVHRQELNLRARHTDGIRRETYAYHGCYGTNSVLAIKINIVLEIDNSSSSADRWEGTGDLKTLSKFYQVTFHFKISWLATL